MKRTKIYGCLLLFVGLSVVFGVRAGPVFPVTVLDSDDTVRAVDIQKVTISGDKVAGEVVNRSDTIIREIQLQIRYSWRWENEFRPQEDHWGRTVIHTVDKELLPGERVSFNYEPSPPVIPQAGGYFDTSVSVAGFTQVL